MASLNTLRTKGGLIVSIVIGVALIAFLLGDFLSTGTGMVNSRKMRVGEIDGTKIGYAEFLNQANYTGEVTRLLYGRESLNAQEQEAVYDMAWESLMMKYSYGPGFERLGLTNSVAEKTDMVSGVYVSPVIRSVFVNPSTGVYDVEVLRSFIANAGANPQAAQMWQYIKKQMNDQRLMNKFADLVSRGFYVTDLQVEQGTEAANSSYDIAYIAQPYSAVADSLVTVTNADIRKYYDAHKAMFKQTASRDLEYIVFDLFPSEEDYAEAEKYMDELAVEFAESEAPMQYATLNSQEAPSKRYLKASELDANLSALAFGPNRGGMYGPELNGEVYTMSRVADMRMLPDTIGARHILLPAGQQAKADSLVAVIRKGGNFSSLASEFSADQGSAQRGGDLGRFAPDQMIPEFSDACVAAASGDVFTVSSPYGIHVVEMTYKSPLVNKVQIATITYRVEPSQYTQQTVYADVSKFVSAAGNHYETFTQAIDNGNLTRRTVRLRSTDRTIKGMDNSKELVRWAFTNKQGAVSPIMEVDGNYVIAALTGVREHGIAPLDQVSEDIRTRLVRQKKGEYLAARMQGNTLQEVAEKVDTQVKEADGVQFSSFYIQGLGVEPKLIGAVTGANEHTLSKPVDGVSGVFLFEVNGIAMLDKATVESERVLLESAALSYLNERITQALVEESDVTDMRVKFF